ncbi:membrane protein [Streptococcus suis]|uniref:Membrane protein n=1 Tax=Streptococcus suis TaxID=1307 RepID=A0A0Z8X4N6_STRSU|nr:membrane protein [Streptococcus suis]
MSFSVISSYLIQHPVLTALLIAHFLSDFTFQSQALADDKKLHLKALFMHLFIVSLPLLILALLTPVQNGDLFFQVWLSHLAIDYVKYFLNKHHWIKETPGKLEHS